MQRLEWSVVASLIRLTYQAPMRGQQYAGSLADAGLTLDDKPLFAIRLEGVRPGEAGPRVDPIYERDKHLVD